MRWVGFAVVVGLLVAALAGVGQMSVRQDCDHWFGGEGVFPSYEPHGCHDSPEDLAARGRLEAVIGCALAIALATGVIMFRRRRTDEPLPVDPGMPGSTREPGTGEVFHVARPQMPRTRRRPITTRQIVCAAVTLLLGGALFAIATSTLDPVSRRGVESGLVAAMVLAAVGVVPVPRPPPLPIARTRAGR